MNPRFITAHIVTSLPLHNLNRDQNGLPKSQFDGGVQRARLSAQALKRAARVGYRTLGHDESMRTRQAKAEVLALATAYAEQAGLPFDLAAGRKAVGSVIDGLTKSEKNTEAKNDRFVADARNKAAKQAAKDKLSEEATEQAVAEAEERARQEIHSKENIIFLGRHEMATLAHAAVDKQQTEEALTEEDLVGDATSPALEIAAFGRMFANATEKGTHAAVAVSHAATTHQMQLVADYFSAVEDAEQTHAGAGHIGQAYFTSGVYYRTFTIDIDQLRRSWSAMHDEGGREALRDLVVSLIRALPSGRLNNSNASPTPALVLVESQQFRTTYEFDTPVQPAENGGYLQPTIAALAARRALAESFDPANYGDTRVLGETFGADFDCPSAGDLNALVEFVVDTAYAEER